MAAAIHIGDEACEMAVRPEGWLRPDALRWDAAVAEFGVRGNTHG